MPREGHGLFFCDMDSLSDHRKLLELAAEGKLPDRIGEGDQLSVQACRELVEGGLLAGIDLRTKGAIAYAKLHITMAGREFLEKLRQQMLSEHQRILELAAQGKLPKEVDESGSLSIDALRELYEAGYLAAIDATSFDGIAYLEPRITMAGRRYLDEMRSQQGTNISSHGQSGGVTAHTVNVSSAPAMQHDPRPWWLSVPAIILWILTALAAIVAILQFFGIGPLELAMSEKPTTTVTSYNQSGGITAHTVNLEAPRRQMTDQLGAQIKQHVPTSATVRVATVAFDAEAMAFAIQIREWMLRNGYAQVGGVDERGLNTPVFGQEISRKPDGSYVVFIGTRE